MGVVKGAKEEATVQRNRMFGEKVSLFREIQDAEGWVTRDLWAWRVRSDVEHDAPRYRRGRRTGRRVRHSCRCAACRQFLRLLQQLRRWYVVERRSGEGGNRHRQQDGHRIVRGLTAEERRTRGEGT